MDKRARDEVRAMKQAAATKARGEIGSTTASEIVAAWREAGR
jgi:hypothetical protein